MARLLSSGRGHRDRAAGARDDAEHGHGAGDLGAGITPVYLEGALARALGVAHHVPLIAALGAAEYQALEDASRLDTAAEVARTTADIDAAAARVARADADRIQRERLATERALAATEEAAATTEATLHERAAREARAIAADARRRRRATSAVSSGKRQAAAGGGKKKK